MNKNTETSTPKTDRNFIAAGLATFLALTIALGFIVKNEYHNNTPVRATPPTSLPAPINPLPFETEPVGNPNRPNIVFINADDMRADDLRYMPKTKRLLGGHGVNFTQSISPHPLCCPARAQYATGQYGQNNGVHHNTGRKGGYKALRNPTNTVGKWLSEAGYQTAFVGKYLNGYNGQPEAATGWTRWNPVVEGIYSFNNTTFFNDGKKVRYTDQVDDVMTGYTNLYIQDFAAQKEPFFIWVSNLAPHIRATPQGWKQPLPSERHKNKLMDTRPASENQPSYLVPKQKVIPSKVQYGEVRPNELVASNRLRAQSLLTLDDEVASVVKTLREEKVLDNTYIFFTSDNGFLLGEHHKLGKNKFYQESLRVPLLVRTPEPGKRTSDAPVTSTDLAPTFASLAKAKPGRLLDGSSFQSFLNKNQFDDDWRDSQLVQAGEDSLNRENEGWLWRGVRTDRYTFVAKPNPKGELTPENEVLYDRETDPFELTNVADDPRYLFVKERMKERSIVLFPCSGPVCDTSFGDPGEPLEDPIRLIPRKLR